MIVARAYTGNSKHMLRSLHLRTNRVPIQVVKTERPSLVVTCTVLVRRMRDHSRSPGTYTMLWFELLTKRQRKCRMTTKIPLIYREPTWWMSADPELGDFRGFSPNSPPASA